MIAQLLFLFVIWVLHKWDLSDQRDRLYDEARDEMNLTVANMLHRGWTPVSINARDFWWSSSTDKKEKRK